jgi:hypothetical protein
MNFMRTSKTRWRRYVHPKRRFTQKLHVATSHKMVFFIITDAKTSNLTQCSSMGRLLIDTFDDSRRYELLKMEATRSSETSVHTSATRHHIPRVEAETFRTEFHLSSSWMRFWLATVVLKYRRLHLIQFIPTILILEARHFHVEQTDNYRNAD